MKVTIIYFSQTGNTRSVAETMVEAFRENGHNARAVSLKKATPQEATTSDLLGIGTPCFASQAPKPVKSFLNSLPRLESKRAFVFATSGGAPGRVLYDLTSLLQSKGAEVIGGFLTRGEIHYPPPSLIGRFAHRPNAGDLAEARDFARMVSEHVISGWTGCVAGSRPDTMRPQGTFYNTVAFFCKDTFLRQMLPEPKLDPVRCDGCQWCAYECPMHNISLDPYPKIGRGCIRCYRCLTGCPQEAFKVDWKASDLPIRVIYHPIFERWFGDLKAGEIIYPEVGKK